MFAALLGQSLVDFSCLLVSGTVGERSAKSVSFPHSYGSSHLYSFSTRTDDIKIRGLCFRVLHNLAVSPTPPSGHLSTCSRPSSLRYNPRKALKQVLGETTTRKGLPRFALSCLPWQSRFFFPHIAAFVAYCESEWHNLPWEDKRRVNVAVTVLIAEPPMVDDECLDPSYTRLLINESIEVWKAHSNP